MGFFEFVIWRRAVYLRVHGIANMNNSHLFKDLVDNLLERRYESFFVDLAHCDGIDSTFMGVLVGISLYEAERPAAAAGASANDASDNATGDNATGDNATRDNATRDNATRDSATRDSATRDSAPAVMVLNAGDVCARQMQSVGLEALIAIKAQTVQLPQGAVFERLEEREFDPHRRVQLIADAHRNLVRVDSRNEQIFGSFLQALSSELSQHG